MRVLTKVSNLSLPYQLIVILSFSIFMAVSSQVKINLWFTPVPVTFQTLVLFLSIVFLKKKAFISQAIYVSLGLIGVPVFSKGAGLFYLLGSTGGYILGFFIVALLFPYLIEKIERSSYLIIKLFLIFLVANISIYLFGTIWLKIFLKISLMRAIGLGIIPFIIGDLFKILIASTISCRVLN